MRDRVTFLLNGRKVEATGTSPTTTLLEWLRRDRRLTGTKEGCAEGDCGACTVLVGRPEDGAVRHHTLNACIAFLPMLEGSSVHTVESLSVPGQPLHPVQRALVDCHGSQCGFCTPGFVMTLYAMYLAHDAAPPAAEVSDALAGNLCRCTGYGPILAAGERMFAYPRPLDAAAKRLAESTALADISHTETVCIVGDGARMYLPATLDELCALAAAHPEATIVSGATDVGLWATKQMRTLPTLIYAGRVRDPAFQSLSDTSIGAGVTLQRLATHCRGSLAELIGRFAGPQVRAVATVGGNIANGSPIGDLAPALIALGARVRLRRGGSERSLPLEDFFLAYGRQDRRPGEIAIAFDMPPGWHNAPHLTVHKVSKRREDDISAVCGAFALRIENGLITQARIAFGGMAEIPKRAVTVEAALVGKPFVPATIEAAVPGFAVDFQPISDMRASAAYRLKVAGNLLRRAYLERAQPGLAINVARVAAVAGA